MFERCLYFNTNFLARELNRAWEAEYKKLGLSPSYAYLLRLVNANPGLPQKEIANELRLEKSTITRFIQALEREGYLVRKKVEEGDKREFLIFPSEKCLALSDELEAIGKSLYDKVCNILGKKELSNLVTELRKIGQAL
ncbi:MAG: MarR family transcriptional regulator [Gammaproteobacteria bacterium]|nr:MarR family transcriptional regulator [Gammaproteobacteria bacterium]MDH5694640.1 MarR family transcriptional regulator [Gammaproteobacteria bacterium]